METEIISINRPRQSTEKRRVQNALAGRVVIRREFTEEQLKYSRVDLEALEDKRIQHVMGLPHKRATNNG